MPDTPIARALTLRSDKPGEDAPEGTQVAAQSAADKAVPESGPQPGDEGEAISTLRPVGTCVINGKREQCLAVGGTIRPRTRIQVVAVDGMHIRVKAMDA